MKKLRIEIDNCEDCNSLDEGAFYGQNYCNHADAPRDNKGEDLLFDAEDGIPKWCPLEDAEE